MEMDAFQSMILRTLERHLGPRSEDFYNTVCKKMGVPIETLRHKHMERFSELVYVEAAPLIGEDNAKFLSGVIGNFKDSFIGR